MISDISWYLQWTPMYLYGRNLWVCILCQTMSLLAPNPPRVPETLLRQINGIVLLCSKFRNWGTFWFYVISLKVSQTELQNFKKVTPFWHNMQTEKYLTYAVLSCAHLISSVLHNIFIWCPIQAGLSPWPSRRIKLSDPSRSSPRHMPQLSYRVRVGVSHFGVNIYSHGQRR